MKKLAIPKALTWFCLVFSAFVVFGLISLPWITEIFLKRTDLGSVASIQSVRIEKAGLWGAEVADVELETAAGRISFPSMQLRYDPMELGTGTLRVISLTSPQFEFDTKKLSQVFSAAKITDADQQSLKVQSVNMLDNLPVNHLRIRDGTLNLNNERFSCSTDLDVKADLYPSLAQFQMDGNLSGFPWSGDLSMVKEGVDLFLGASMRFKDLSSFPSFLQNAFGLMGGVDFEVANLFSVDRGSARVRWTGRLEDEGIIDQFCEVNASNVKAQIMGFELDVSQLILFLTPKDLSQFEAAFYANLDYGKNFQVHGLKISTIFNDESYRFTGGVQKVVTKDKLPATELIGLTVDRVNFAKNEEDEIINLEEAEFRFSAFHFDEGMFNLYDGQVLLRWLGEDRFKFELTKASGSIPTVGLNFSNFKYSGEIVLGEFPVTPSPQSIEIEEAFLGEDQKVEDFKILWRVDSLERIEISELAMRVNEFDFSLDPANLAVEFLDQSSGRTDLFLQSSKLIINDPESVVLKNIQGNLRFDSFDPIDSNGTQNVRFDIQVKDKEFSNGKLEFEFHPDGVKSLGDLQIEALGGSITLNQIEVGNDISNLQIKTLVEGINAQELINYFDDLDAQIDGNLSGLFTLHNHPQNGWDFYSGSLSLDQSENAFLNFQTHGLLSDGLDQSSSEFERMHLLELALQNLNLQDLNVMFKVSDEGNRLVEMNIRGSSLVDGDEISVEYRPKIIGGLDDLIKQANFLSSSSDN